MILVWLFVHAGLASANGAWYLFFSGIGADALRVVMVTIVGGGLTRLHRQRASHHSELMSMHERHHKELLVANDDGKACLRLPASQGTGYSYCCYD